VPRSIAAQAKKRCEQFLQRMGLTKNRQLPPTMPSVAAELRKRFGRRYAETSISARLRDLRHKGWRIDRERTRPKSGLYQYRAMKVSA
jgi:hypothetical protein